MIPPPASPFVPPPARRIAVVCLRRLGDVLLTAPLLRSLRAAYPQARIEALVFAGTQGALEGHPDVDAVLALPPRRGLAKILPLLRRYDLAFCTQASDRPHLIAWWIARRRIAVVPRPREPGYHWKRWLAWRWTELPAGDTHTVVQYLRLAQVCGIAPAASGLPPRAQNFSRLETLLDAGWQTRRYAVLHPTPKFRYKEWPAEHWCALVRALAARGLEIVITGSTQANERARATTLVAAAPSGCAHEVAGRIGFGELAALIARAQVFVGPDTSITHLAALSGAPTVALFGPSSPTVWGPWPQGAAAESPSPWRQRAPLQRRGNVWLLQGEAPCVPCLLEGCERHLDSYSRCLEAMPPARVIAAVDEALNLSSAKAAPEDRPLP